MKFLTIYEKNHVKLELALSWKDVFFRLQVPNISANYRNPLKCATVLLEKLAKHEMK